MDTVPRIGSFLSGRKPEGVSVNTPLAEVMKTMFEKKYSQILIFDGDNDKGSVSAVSWQSIAKHFYASPNNLTAKDCKEEAPSISEDSSIEEASNVISNHDYVVITGKNGIGVKGIVTASDFMESTKSFILIGAIEEKIRLIIKRIGKKTPSDQTFGNYLNFFNYLKSGGDAGLISDEFIEKLEVIRDIRNRVMHFDGDWNRENDRKELKDFYAYLEKILKKFNN